MNNTEIQIIDTHTNTHVTKDELALASSIRWGWKGGDRKDELSIVGSYLKFTMVGLSCEDAQYYDLFTGDETRHKVIYKNMDTGDIYFQGYLLPDLYSEPYRNNVIPVDFTATDGLGGLKGKFLPDDFYKEEKSVISILSECLKLTGLDLDFRFAPAIENREQKDYNQIYINTSLYQKEGDKEEAYKILEDLLTSMLCVVYQAENFFNIEGYNIRDQRVYKAKLYNIDGAFIEEQEITRNMKAVTPLATPNVTMQPPVGYLNVSHEKPLFSLKEGLSSETNEGWTYRTEALQTYNSTTSQDKESLIYVTDWFGRNGFFAYSGTDNKVFFTHPSASYPESGQRIDLNYRPYIKAGQKYKLKFEFEIKPFSNDEEVNKKFIEAGNWQNPFRYDIAYWSYTNPNQNYNRIIGNGTASSNVKYFPINFGEGDKKTITVDFQFIPKYSGDFIFTIRPLNTNIGIDKVYINELSLTLIGEKEERVISGNLLDGWTTKKEVELDYSSDANGLGKTFRLKKLNEPQSTTTIEHTVVREFDFRGKHYVSLRLYAANLVDENRDKVKRPSDADPNILEPVNVLDVIYNFNNSDEHVVITENPINTGKLFIDTNDYGFTFESREYWEQWTDIIYQVERLNYTQAVYNVYSRALNKELPAVLDLTVKNNIKFNDFIKFKYGINNEFILTNCEIDVDKGLTDVSIIQKYYVTEGEYNPIVELGDPVYIEETSGSLLAEAFDPDGFIVSYDWEEITNTGSTLTQLGEEAEFNLPSNVYYARFRVTVTDNDGNTGSDEVDVYRIPAITASLTEIYSEELQFRDIKHYRFDLSPDLPENMSITVSGVLRLKYHGSYFMQSIDMLATIAQNGAYTTSMVNDYDYNTDAPDTIQLGENNNLKGSTLYFDFSYIRGDEVIITLNGEFDDNNQNSLPISVEGSVDITEISFNDGFGVITGIPINKSISVSQLV